MNANMKSMRFLLAILLAVWGVAAFAQTGERIIRAGDQINVVCKEEAAISRVYTVSEDGFILVQFLGKVKVEGLTRAEAAKAIATRLLDFVIVRTATVTVDFAGSTPPPVDPNPPAAVGPVKLRGEAASPGEMPFREGLRLADAIRQAGPLETTDLTAVVILRGGERIVVDYSRNDPATNSANPLLRSGDEIVFARKAGGQPVTPPPPTGTGSVFVLGGVLRPGQVQLAAGTTLRQAVQAVGGFSSNADRTRVRIERGSGSVAYNLSVEGTDAPLQDGDQIVVEVFNQTRFIELSGGIRTPGLMSYEQGMTLGQAILRAGGPVAGSDPGKVQIIRQGEVENKITINFSEIEQGYRGDIPLMPGDRVVIPTKGKGRSNLIGYIAGGLLFFFLIRG